MLTRQGRKAQQVQFLSLPLVDLVMLRERGSWQSRSRRNQRVRIPHTRSTYGRRARGAQPRWKRGAVPVASGVRLPGLPPDESADTETAADPGPQGRLTTHRMRVRCYRLHASLPNWMTEFNSPHPHHVRLGGEIDDNQRSDDPVVLPVGIRTFGLDHC